MGEENLNDVRAGVGRNVAIRHLWPLKEASRQRVVQKIAANLTSASFFKGSGGARLDDEAAQEHALVIEREAFIAADAKFREQEEQEENAAAEGQGVRFVGSAAVLAYARHAGDGMVALLQAKIVPAGAPAVPPAEEKQEKPAEFLELDLARDGKREFFDRERAEAALAPMLASEATKFTKVRFSTKSFNPEASAVAAEALRRAGGSLLHADLSDIIAGQKEEDALAVLREVCGALAGCNLRVLDLSNNALGEKGVRACAAALTTQHALEELYFVNNGISAGAAEVIVEMLPDDSARSLTTLHFHNNMTGDDGAKVLADLIGRAAQSRLTNLRFSSTRVGSDGGVALAQALGRGSNLLRLDMRDNMFGAEGGEALAAALRQHHGLLELYLGDTSLGDEGAAAVVEALAANCRELKVLDLGGNDITAEGASRIAASLDGLPHLARLILSENELGDQGAATVARALTQYNRELEELDLGTNEIRDLGARAAAAAACELPHVRSLNLNGNSISRAAIADITSMLHGSAHGESVLGPLDENEDDED